MENLTVVDSLREQFPVAVSHSGNQYVERLRVVPTSPGPLPEYIAEELIAQALVDDWLVEHMHWSLDGDRGSLLVRAIEFVKARVADVGE